MNIEESKSLLSWVSLNKLYIDTHNECDYHNIHTAIETLLTAYEKEKEKVDSRESFILYKEKEITKLKNEIYELKKKIYAINLLSNSEEE